MSIETELQEMIESYTAKHGTGPSDTPEPEGFQRQTQPLPPRRKVVVARQSLAGVRMVQAPPLTVAIEGPDGEEWVVNGNPDDLGPTMRPEPDRPNEIVEGCTVAVAGLGLFTGAAVVLDTVHDAIVVMVLDDDVEEFLRSLGGEL